MPTLQYYKRILNAYIINKKQSNLSFWHTPLAINPFSDVDLKAVRRYPQNFVAKTKIKGAFDNNGIIILNYFGALGYQYNPNAIAQIGLGYYDCYLDDPHEEYKHKVITNANWFVSNGRLIKDDIILWEYNFPFEMRKKLERPWRSALAQGQAISLLLRAHYLSGNEKYLKTAIQGYNAFRYEGLKHEGGVFAKDEENNIWLEEVIINPPNHILNGFIWALWGVYEYAKYLNDDHAYHLYNTCLDTLKSNLYKYDLGYWTSYDLVSKSEPTMIVSNYYQTLHTIQMLGCYTITKNELFINYYKKWQGYLNSIYCKSRAIIEKIYFKLRYF